MQNTQQALDQLVSQWLSHYGTQSEGFPLIDQDSQWPSVCEINDTEADGQVRWQLVKRQTPGDFGNIEQALELVLHDDIKTYYARYWGAELVLEHVKGPLTLLQIWNDDDFANLQQNIIGHIMMKRRLKQKVTIFFALTDLEDQMISIINDSGEIWLEYVGQEPHLKLADSMAAFLGALKVSA